MLCHPGASRTEATIRDNFSWRNLRSTVTSFVKNCPECQRFKTNRKHYGHLPPADPTFTPWETVALDLSGPYHASFENCTLSLLVLTVIDIATRWIEIVRLHDKRSETVALAFDRIWMSCYPRPLFAIFDQGSEFIGFEFQELLDSLGILKSPTTIKNPQANAIIERVHGTMHNMTRTFNLRSITVDTESPDDPFDGILSSISYALRATHQTSLSASPGQLVFGRDMFFPTEFIANWEHLRRRRLESIKKDNLRENSRRINHDYRVGDKVLLRRDYGGAIIGKLDSPTSGPYYITEIFTNGTVRIDRTGFNKRINIRRLIPYSERSH